MKNKLYRIMVAFMMGWTISQVFQEEYSHALVYSISAAISYAIYLGLHLDVKNRLFKEINKT